MWLAIRLADSILLLCVIHVAGFLQPIQKRWRTPWYQVALKELEEIVHPLVSRERRKWLLQNHEEGGHSVLLLDIPLLFETATEDMVHFCLGFLRRPLCIVVYMVRQLYSNGIKQMPFCTVIIVL